jgi:A/G-specific adenine glycosylase
MSGQRENDKGSWFREQLMQWHREQNTRAMPWKGLRDPYKIWLSEIILQQTRVEQGLPYYERFLTAYPTVHDLAAASEEEVFRHWQGLGYYSRARNLHHTAKVVAYELAGNFPQSYEGLLRLKGIGTYTAAAIASFAFALPHAVVDGNVVRVLARFCGIALPAQSTEGRKHFERTAAALLDTDDPGGYNQAIMDHGATVCTPARPDCEECPVQEKCFAFKERKIDELPVRTRKAALKQRHFHYLILENGERAVWIRRRTEGIWSGLYEPLLIEADNPLDRHALEATGTLQAYGIGNPIEYEGELIHLLTHQRVTVRFFSRLISRTDDAVLPANGVWVPRTDLSRYAMPKPLVTFFENKSYF